MDQLATAGWVVPTVAAGAAATALLYYKMRLPEPTMRSPAPLDKQSIELPGKERIHVANWGDADKRILETSDPNVTTMYESFERGRKMSDNGQCVGWRKDEKSGYTWMTYKEVLDRAHKFGSGLQALGSKPEQKTFIGIYSANCPEWIVSSLACMAYSMVVVPLYDSLGHESSAHIINQCNITTVVCDKAEKAKLLIEGSKDTPHLKHIIIVKPFQKDDLPASTIKCHAFSDVLQSGAQNFQDPKPPKPDDLYIICYTSGTTGLPKGVMLTHKNLVANLSAAVMMFDYCGIAVKPGDKVLSYLPLAHMFEQIVEALIFYCGAAIGFSQGNIKLLMDDAKVLKPDIFPVVPRLLNRLYDQVQHGLGKNIAARALFNVAYAAKLNEMKKGVFRRDTIWDRLVFKKIQDGMGGNVRLMLTGSAPVSAEVLEFSRVVLGCYIFEGYGQTECTAGCSWSLPGDMTGGHVGAPCPCTQIKLVDVPDLKAFAKDNKGEICLRGANVMQGYYKDPEKTKETLIDGWLHTGDVGEWQPNGTLKVIDRKKQIFKLAQGEYVAPEKIENVYQRLPIVSQVFVEGKSEERFLIAVVVPEMSQLKKLAKEKGVSGSKDEELCENADLKKAVLEQLRQMGKEGKLNSIEQVQAVHLTPEHWTVENELLTPTMKAKRPQLREHYKEAIENMYKEAKGKGGD